MIWTLEDFMEDYPGGYEDSGVIYNRLHMPVGYVTETGDYRIDKDPMNSGKMYHIEKKNKKY